MIEFAEQMVGRLKHFALRIIKLFQKLPKTAEARIIGKQLLRSATSAAANYRAVCRARSDNEFFAKLSIVVEELDEAVFWLELLIDAKIIRKELLEDLLKEGNELLKIVAKSRKTMKARKNKKYITKPDKK